MGSFPETFNDPLSFLTPCKVMLAVVDSLGFWIPLCGVLDSGFLFSGTWLFISSC